MKSGWKVSTTYTPDGKVYQVYRLKDVDKTDESGNREYLNQTFPSKNDAQIVANELNKRAAERFFTCSK